MKRTSRRKQFLLVRPLGGLNDVLCQVEFARRLAKKSGRSLIVQTETGSPSLKHRFGQPFSNVFLFVDKSYSFGGEILEQLVSGGEKVFPEVYTHLGQWKEKSLEELSEGALVQSRLTSLPSEYQILIHEGFGGGSDSFCLLEHVVLPSRLAIEIRRIVRLLPPNRIAVHFRNSDYRSRYENLLASLHDQDPTRPILLASDDPSALTLVREKLPSRVVVSAKELIGNNRYSPTEVAVLEMFLMSTCTNLVLIPLDKDTNPPSFSGFGFLVRHLWSVARIQANGPSEFCKLLMQVALGDPRRRTNPFRLLAFLLVRAPALFRQGFMPKGIYKQLGELR